MITDSPRRVLAFMMLIMACGCGSGPGGPAAAPSAGVGSLGAAEDGLAPSDRFPDVATGDPELDPLVSFLKGSFAGLIREGHRLVIDDRTDVADLQVRGSYQDLLESLLKQASDQVPAEMIRDFGEKNRESRAVWPELSRHLPVILLTRKDQEGLFSRRGADGWERFDREYPGSGGIITVSRVGLNREGTLALFYMGWACGGLCGNGQLHVLKKEGGVWVELPVQIGLRWIS